MAGAWRHAVADGEPVSGEYRLLRHDGQYRRVVVSAVPIRDADGRIREWVGSHTDVEEERRATELTQTIAENAASALFMMDQRGHPTYMNSAAIAMTGFTLDEIRGRPLHDSVHHTRPDGTPYPIEDCPIDRALLRERPVEPYEDVFVRKDGSFFPVRVAAAPITRDRVPAGTVIEVQDITAEQEAERELEARASAAEALEFVGEGILLVDSGGVVRLWNPAAAVITGLRAEDVEGRPAREAIPQWEEFASRVPTVTPADARVSSGETVPVELGGSELWLSATAVSFGSGTVYAFRNVTEERGLERLKSEFVSTVSHELRTPLAAIYGAALTLRRSDLTLSEELRRELLSVVADEADRLARIVNDILWTSRIESGGLHVRIEHCDARELASRVVSVAQTHLPETFSIELHAGDGLPEVAVDSDKVRQVLANLVDNAVKYSPDGGRIEVRVAAVGGRVRFAVSDEGLGVPLGERDRVFEKFYRLDPDLTRGVGGTGLGLYICRELVRRMDGWIWVEPKEPRGSVFVVDLPGVE
jgi:PAS domain S-box-containing protein